MVMSMNTMIKILIKFSLTHQTKNRRLYFIRLVDIYGIIRDTISGASRSLSIKELRRLGANVVYVNIENGIRSCNIFMIEALHDKQLKTINISIN